VTRSRRRWSGLLLAAVFALGATPLGAPATRAVDGTDYAADCTVDLQAATVVASQVMVELPADSVVTVTGIVSGDAWSASCPNVVSGSTWYTIGAVGGLDVQTVYGVAVVYAPTGLFRIAGTPPNLEGIDISRWQGSVDFGMVRDAGIRFIIAKATEGIGYGDPNYTTNRLGATAAGLPVTAYHYARPDLNPTNPQGEADWFVDNLALAPGMLLPALDLEVAGKNSVAALQAWVGTWLDRVYARTGARPMIYTSPAFWAKYMGDTTLFADQGYSVLWLAHWFVTSPTVPANNWSNHGWTFWQYNDCGTVPGISGCVDLDRFHGTDLTSVTFGADFAASMTPGVASIKQGETTDFTVGLARTGFAAPVDVSVTGLPPGATATFASPRVTGDSTSFTVAPAVDGTLLPAGTWPLTVTALSSGLTRTATASLEIIDGIPPEATAPVYRLAYPSKLVGTTVPVRVVWTATDPSGIGLEELQGQVGDGVPTPVKLPAPTTTSVTTWPTVGSTYGYAVRATDTVGNVNDWTAGPKVTALLTQESSSSVKYSGTWTRSYATAASAGSLRYATRAGASATFTFTGSGVAWVAYRGPNRGSVGLYVDGVFQRTLSLYAKAYSAKQVAYSFNWTENGKHTIKIVCLGTPGHPRVDLDAFIRLNLS
jgi:GH25 family lysozyme M1 (1,4-beta-N-acetylmuramidase)